MKDSGQPAPTTSAGVPDRFAHVWNLIPPSNHGTGTAAIDRSLRVRIGPRRRPPAELRPRIDEVWADLTRDNPRAFDGPIVAVVAFDPRTPELHCRRESYRMLAVAGRVPVGTHQLGVTGLLVGRDSRGTEHVLLGRRSGQTRIYGGMWEIAPAGGLDPPRLPDDADEDSAPEIVLTRDDIVRMMIEEAREEVGIEVRPEGVEPICIYRDERGNHDGIVCRADLPGVLDTNQRLCAGGNWEYLDIAWVAVPDLHGFVRDNPEAIVPGALGVWKHLGWI